MPTACHLIVGDDPWCDWTGSKAGQDINAKAGHQCCGHPTQTAALAAAAALRPFFKRGRVKVVAGQCPRDLEARQTLADFAAQADA